MGFGNFFKNLFTSTPVAVDYANLNDEEILRLSETRSGLTEEAQNQLAQELEKRQLEARDLVEPEPFKTGFQIAQEIDEESEKRHERLAAFDPIEGDPVVVLGRQGVLLRTQRNEGVLLLLPIWDEEAPFELPTDLEVEVTDIVVFNQTELGWLPTAYVAERLQVKRVHLLDGEQPADRPFPEVTVEHQVKGRALQETTEIGWLTLEKSEYENVLIASWEQEEIPIAIAVGPQVPLTILVEEQLSLVIGGFAPLVAGEKDLLTRPELFGGLESVILLLDCAGVSSWPTLLSAQVEISAFGKEKGSESSELILKTKRAAEQGAWEEAEKLLEELSAEEIEDVVDSLIIERSEEAATRILDLALASPDWQDAGRILFLRGAQFFMSGAVDEAITFYEKAVSAEEPEPRAYANLSAIHRRRKEYRAAIRSAQTGLEAMPGDSIMSINLACSTADQGDIDQAKTIISEAGLGPLEAEWHARLDQWEKVEEGPDEFPHLASKAFDVGCLLHMRGQHEEALGMMKRCLELQPSHLEAVVEIGSVYVSAGREEEALTHYEQQLEQNPKLAFVRFNKANCLIRSERFEEAIADLETIVEQAPSWDAPYVNLIGALMGAEQFDQAHEVLAQLEQAAPDSEHLEVVRQQLENLC